MTRRLDSVERRALAATALVAVAASPLARSPGATLDGALDLVRKTIRKDPLKATLGTVAASAALFYAAEKGHNEKVETLEDALVYCSTCLSVGYDRTFPVTRTGKRIAALLMAIGPAMAARALDDPEP